MPQRPIRTLVEASCCTGLWGMTPNRNGNSVDRVEDDFVSHYRQWRTECPDHGKTSHEAFCQRCDNSFPSQIGGADFLRKQGIVETNPFEKFPEPLQPREGPKVSPPLWEHLGSFIKRVPLAPRNPGAKIEELTEVTVREKNLMADNEATRALFRELLGMTGGANASGRGTLHIPDDIMDSMAGDAAQDSLARNSLIMEMRHREDRRRGSGFVSLDLMEMEADHVDEFLSNARKKIIKRSKSTRKVCCSRIGGVLDQMLGLAGGEYADEVEADDRGKHDPIGDADDAQTYRKVKTEDNEILQFISEEFDCFEHDTDCAFAEPSYTPFEEALGEQKYFRAPRRTGLLREHFHLQEGEGLSLDKAKAALAMLKQKKAAGKLSGKEASLMPRLAQYVKMAGKGGGDDQDKQEESINMEPSQTANALSSFMEASGAVNRYKTADAGSGKGSPDSGQASYSQPVGQPGLKTRPDNADYPTALAPVKGGGNASKVSGQPQSLSTRGKDRGDPIGEDNLDENLHPDHIAVYKFRKEHPDARQARISHYKETGEVMDENEGAPEISETASALSNFMEANYQYAEAKKRLALGSKDAGDLELNKREQQRLGGPLKSAKGDYPSSNDAGPRYKPGSDPRGAAHDKGAGKN